MNNATDTKRNVDQVNLVAVHACQIHLLNPVAEVVDILNVLPKLEAGMTSILTHKLNGTSFVLTTNLTLISLILSEKAKPISKIGS